MGVSENSGTPKIIHLIGFSIINHPIWVTTIFGNTNMLISTQPVQFFQTPTPFIHRMASMQQTFQRQYVSGAQVGVVFWLCRL